MPTDPADNLLGLVAPVGGDNANGPDGFQDIIDQLALSVGMVKIAGVADQDANVQFSSIPQGFRGLKLVGATRSAHVNGEALKARFNNNSGATKYSYHYLRHDRSSTPSFGGSAGDDEFVLPNATAAASLALLNFELTIPLYKSAIYYKAMMGKLYAFEGAGTSWEFGGSWDDAAAINQIDLYSASGLRDATVTLYGLL
jgi:hypothetical protein